MPNSSQNTLLDRFAFRRKHFSFFSCAVKEKRKMFQWLGDVFDLIKLAWHFRTILWQKATFFQNESNAKTLALLLQKRGAFFVKLGQWLGQRPDIVPKSFCAELKRLQVDAPQHTWRETLQVCNNINLFDYMKFLDIDVKTNEPVSFSSGSIAQVYRVETTVDKLENLQKQYNCKFFDKPTDSGKADVLRCVFKVCHPNVAQTFARSLRTVTQLYLFAQRIMGSGSSLALINIHDVVATELQRQCDLLCEAEHGKKLRKNFANNPYVGIPFIYLASSQFLFEEYVENAIFYDDIGKPSRDSCVYESELEKQQTRILVKEMTMAAFFQMILHDGCSHGDCHSGNILYQLSQKTPAVYKQQLANIESHAIDGHPIRVAPVDIKVWFLDFGIVVDVDDNLRNTMLQLTLSINASDALLMARAFESVLIDREKLSADALHKFETDCIRTNKELRARDLAGRGSSIQDQIMVIVENFRVHNLRLEAAALRIIISWLLIDENTPVLGQDDTLPDNALRWVNMEDTNNYFHLHEVSAYIIGARTSRILNEHNKIDQFAAPDLTVMHKKKDEKRDVARLFLDTLRSDDFIASDWKRHESSEQMPLVAIEKRKKKRFMVVNDDDDNCDNE